MKEEAIPSKSSPATILGTDLFKVYCINAKHRAKDTEVFIEWN